MSLWASLGAGLACRTTPQLCQEPVHWQHEQLLIYHVIELTLEAIYMLQRLFCGPLSQVWGNWLDIVLLIMGISELRRQHQVSGLPAGAAAGASSARPEVRPHMLIKGRRT